MPISVGQGLVATVRVLRSSAEKAEAGGRCPPHFPRCRHPEPGSRSTDSYCRRALCAEIGLPSEPRSSTSGELVSATAESFIPVVDSRFRGGINGLRKTWGSERFTKGAEAGKNIRWVADQLGHADPALALRVYAPAMRDEEADLNLAEFRGPGRPYAAPLENEAGDEPCNSAERLARREGFESPTLRFEGEDDPEETPPFALS